MKDVASEVVNLALGNLPFLFQCLDLFVLFIQFSPMLHILRNGCIFPFLLIQTPLPQNEKEGHAENAYNPQLFSQCAPCEWVRWQRYLCESGACSYR